MNLKILPGKFAVCRLGNESNFPSWLKTTDFFSITKTSNELSIVCIESIVPENVKAEKNWKILEVEGPLDFSMTGVLASISAPLADAQISIFAISTFDTDYILVRDFLIAEAVSSLKKAGFNI